MNKISYAIGITINNIDHELTNITKRQLDKHIKKNKENIYYICKINKLSKHNMMLYTSICKVTVFEYINNYTTLSHIYGELSDYDIEIIKHFN